MGNARNLANLLSNGDVTIKEDDIADGSIDTDKLGGSITGAKFADKALEKQFDEVLLYANEYKVDLIDRIKKVDDKIQPVDLTIVFKEIAKVREQIAMLDIPEDVDLKPISKELKRLSEEMVRVLSNLAKINLVPLEESIKIIEDTMAEISKKLAIVSKENEVQDAEIKEIKLKSNNPLAN